MELKNSSALVTGGAGGFGSATARRLAEAGCHVVIADIHEERGNDLAREIGEGRATFVLTDVFDGESIENAIEVAKSKHPLRVAVVAHGGPSGGAGRIVGRDGSAYSTDDFTKTISSYLISAFAVSSRAAAAMSGNETLADGHRGVVITTASIAGFEGQVGQVAYSAAKGGIIGMTLTAARDLAPIGVRFMSIAPGTFYTYAYGADEAGANEKWGPGVPFPKRMGRADEYAQLALQIAQNDYLNGTVIRIDGAQRFGM